MYIHIGIQMPLQNHRFHHLKCSVIGEKGCMFTSGVTFRNISPDCLGKPRIQDNTTHTRLFTRVWPYLRLVHGLWTHAHILATCAAEVVTELRYLLSIGVGSLYQAIQWLVWYQTLKWLYTLKAITIRHMWSDDRCRSGKLITRACLLCRFVHVFIYLFYLCFTLIISLALTLDGGNRAEPTTIRQTVRTPFHFCTEGNQHGLGVREWGLGV